VPRYDGVTPPVPRAGPGVGEHNREVYGELNLTGAELAKLKAAQVI